MLVDPNMKAESTIRIPKEILALIDRRDVGLIHLGKGLYQCGHWNFGNLCTNVDDSPEFNRSMAEFMERLAPERTDAYFQKQLAAARRIPANIEALFRPENWKNNDIYLGAYGVCDSPEQLLTLYDFEADPRKLCISFVKIEREHEPEDGGWRWHKWGNYVGLKEPQMEYLHDEPDIEAVYTFHIHEVLE